MSAAVSLPSNVVPLRWTMRGFVRAGVVFTIVGPNITVAGPPNRPDLYDALRTEVERRELAFAKQFPLDPASPVPRVALPGVVPVRSGACDACGDALDVGRGGMCALCTIALQRALRKAGRIR